MNNDNDETIKKKKDPPTDDVDVEVVATNNEEEEDTGHAVAQSAIMKGIGRRARQVDPDPGNEIPWRIRRSLFWHRFYFVLLIVALGALLVTTPRTYLYVDYTFNPIPGNWVFGIFAVVNLIFAHYFVLGSDPGFLDIDVAVNLEEEFKQQRQESGAVVDNGGNDNNAPRRRVKAIASPSIIRSVLNSRSSAIQNGKRKNINNKIVDEYEPDVEAEAAGMQENDLLLNDEDEDGDSDDDVGLVDENEAVDEYVSGVPASQLPVRAKFCRKSRRVVATYDHYCYFLHTTIGERNRGRFYYFLCWAVITLSWALSVANSGFHEAIYGTWLNKNSHALASVVILSFIFALVGSLFVLHTFLMMSNMTTHEFLRADRVSYLSTTRDFDLPFSMGLRENVRFYFTSDALVMKISNWITGSQAKWKPHVWIKPDGDRIDRESTDIRANPWENKYYRCC